MRASVLYLSLVTPHSALTCVVFALLAAAGTTGKVFSFGPPYALLYDLEQAEL